ncbi:MAG TPA: class I SAM-dependent methyltransferase [Deltaproteobacteria bacterium]|nr:class I SAM-dependent methyltransferase [Deltaproteobacteria bacterium]
MKPGVISKGVKKRFEEIETVDHYDGIWCCASLLHVPFSDLPETMIKLERALRPGGIWYISFKYGNVERKEAGRHFTDLNEKSLKQLVAEMDHVNLQTMWITDDVHPKRSGKWLNALLRKEAYMN